MSLAEPCPKDKERELQSFNYEDERCSAVGNSFKGASLAVALAEVWAMRPRFGTHEKS